MNTMTKNEVWAVLQQASLVQGSMPAQEEKHTPWFVRVMLGIAGWLGALFLVGFVVMLMGATFNEAGAFWIMGVIACGVATILFRADRKGDFIAQFGLAVALAGEILMTFGMARWFEKSLPTTHVAFIIAAQQAILLVLMPNFVHRVWAAGTSTLALCFALGRVDLHALALPLMTGGVAVVWLREFHHPVRGELVRACGYGFALTAIFISHANAGYWFYWHGYRSQPVDVTLLRALAYTGRALTFLMTIGVAVLLLQREKVARTSGAGKVALTLAIVLALASVKAPGLAPASLILLLGFANGNRVLTGLGVVALLAYLSHYYYALHATLLEKSMLMMVTGVVLLGLRFAAQRWWPVLNKEEETTHA